MSFHYHEDDFLRSYNTVESPFNDADEAMLGVPEPLNASKYNLYSGLLGAWTYRTQETTSENLVRDGQLLGERFRYDRIGRLRTDTTYRFDGTNWVSDGDGGWSTRFVYDQNSNLIHVKRWGMADGSTSTMLDNSTLSLQSVSGGSNVIESIEDAVNTPTPYEDGTDDMSNNGSITDEKGRQTLTTIGGVLGASEYSSRDEITSIQRAGLTTTFIHDAFGQVAREDIIDASSIVESFYIIPGRVSADRALYYREGTSGTPFILEWSMMSTNRIGISRAREAATNGDIYLRQIGKKLYDLTDHLGSVKALVSDVLVEGGTQAEIIGTNDFDPYGGRRLSRNIDLGEPYRYGFQGMRLVDGLGKSSDYLTMFRAYNVRTASWGAPDPILSASSSLYEALGSNPISLIDPLGDRLKVGKLTGMRLRAFKELMKSLTFKASLARFADAGDKIEIDGQTYVFRKQGDLSISGVDLNIGEGQLRVGSGGTLGNLNSVNQSVQQNGRLQLNLLLQNDDSRLQITTGISILHGMLLSGKIDQRDYDRGWNLGMLQFAVFLGHEIYLHAVPYSLDFIRTGKVSTSPSTQHDSYLMNIDYKYFMIRTITPIARSYNIQLDKYPEFDPNDQLSKHTLYNHLLYSVPLDDGYNFPGLPLKNLIYGTDKVVPGLSLDPTIQFPKTDTRQGSKTKESTTDNTSSQSQPGGKGP